MLSTDDWLLVLRETSKVAFVGLLSLGLIGWAVFNVNAEKPSHEQNNAGSDSPPH